MVFYLSCLSPLSSGLCAGELQQMGCAEMVRICPAALKLLEYQKSPQATWTKTCFLSDLSGSRVFLPCTFAAWTARNVLLPMCSHTCGYMEQVCCMWLRQNLLAQCRQHVSPLPKTCFSCSEGYSGYLCIISWAGREKGICALWRNSSSFSSLFNVMPLFTFTNESLSPTRLLLQSFWQSDFGFGLAGGCRFSFQCVTGFFGSGAEASLSHNTLDTARLINALMYILKAWLFIHFLYTIFRYTPGLRNGQSCFFHVALLFLFSYTSMENHGVGIGNHCFQPIYLYELSFWIIFSAFLVKTVKIPQPFFFFFLPGS